MINEKAFEAFMLATHEHGTSGLGYRKALEAYEAAKSAEQPVSEVESPTASDKGSSLKQTSGNDQPDDISDAKQKALDNFDAWNDVTGAVSKGASWYYELQAVIEDAVDFGAATKRVVVAHSILRETTGADACSFDL